ncbi:hypothetical protein [Simkania sp.]|uniref:hypothetical protein n=1 Tax=Simkania sp. TaxID=34094 RepID=UPI003B52FBEF
MAKVEKSFYDFFSDQVIGGRSIIRLANSACQWAQEITGKTHFAFLGCELDTAALSKNWFKPLDNQIYVVKGTAAIFSLKEKCWNRLSKDDVGTVLRATQHLLKTIGDSSAGLRCLAAFGFVFLSPYVRTLSLMKNSFAVGAGICEIACRVHDIYKLASKPTTTKAEERDKELQWLASVTMIMTQIFSIQLNFFGGCYTAFRDVIPSEKHIPDAVFNFWGTCASLSALGYSAIEYIRTPS